MKFWAKWFRSARKEPAVLLEEGALLSAKKQAEEIAKNVAHFHDYRAAKQEFERLSGQLEEERAAYRLMTKEYCSLARTPNRETYKALLDEVCGAVEAQAHLKLIGASADSELSRSVALRGAAARAAIVAAIYEPAITDDEFQHRREEFSRMLEQRNPVP
ncbi:hypothetical protein [Achromobacter insolitus]|uniref:hypothetical protein n=1 Tax=Achromobacter insolitus TaxID=217204 RepID=UPI002FE04078